MTSIRPIFEELELFKDMVIDAAITQVELETASRPMTEKLKLQKVANMVFDLCIFSEEKDGIS